MSPSGNKMVRDMDGDLQGFLEAPRSGSLFNTHAPHVFRIPRASSQGV